MSVTNPQLEALLKADRQRLLVDLEIQHMKEIEQAGKDATKYLKDKLLAALPKKRNGGASKDFLAGRREVIDQCRKLIEGLK